MNDDNKRRLSRWIGERLGVVIGILGLLAWFAMLWLMFGDVL